MRNVSLVDGTTEIVGSYKDILDIIREKLSPEIAEMLDKYGEYGYEQAYVGLDKLYDKIEKDNIHDKVMESTDLDEVKSYYDSLYYNMCFLL